MVKINRTSLFQFTMVVVTVEIVLAVALSFGADPSVTIALTPRSLPLSNTFTITPVLGKPDAAQQEVSARMLSVTLPARISTQSRFSSSGNRASGLLYFLNEGSVNVTIQSTTLISKGGVAISFLGPVTVPASSLSMSQASAFAIKPGIAGNIPAFDLMEYCCSKIPNARIFVGNREAFSGGQNRSLPGHVSQGDIDAIAAAATTPIAPAVLTHLAQLKNTLKKAERLADASQDCETTYYAMLGVDTVKVTATVTCSEEVYDAQAVEKMGVRLLQAEADQESVTLDGRIAISMDNYLDSNGQLKIEESSRGQGVVSLPTQLLDYLADQIAGESENAARADLLQEADLADIQFHFSWFTSTIPTDVSDIHFVIMRQPLSYSIEPS